MCRMRAESPSLFPHDPLGRAPTSGFSLIEALTVMAITTIGLVIVTRAALRERQYAAVMAATGLLYLAILTAFGTDLVARALLSGN